MGFSFGVGYDFEVGSLCIENEVSVRTEQSLIAELNFWRETPTSCADSIQERGE